MDIFTALLCGVAGYLICEDCSNYFKKIKQNRNVNKRNWDTVETLKGDITYTSTYPYNKGINLEIRPHFEGTKSYQHARHSSKNYVLGSKLYLSQIINPEGFTTAYIIDEDAFYAYNALYKEWRKL